MKKRILIIALISSMLFISCKTKSAIGANYSHEVECLGSELDGSVTLKSWGKGKNRADALEQARKEAVNAVLFTSIRNGKQECNNSPILNAPNIREMKADYFNIFFKDNGDYKKFTSTKDESFGEKEKEKGRDGDVVYGYVIRVLRSELKKQMITDGILKN